MDDQKEERDAVTSRYFFRARGFLPFFDCAFLAPLFFPFAPCSTTAPMAFAGLSASALPRVLLPADCVFPFRLFFSPPKRSSGVCGSSFDRLSAGVPLRDLPPLPPPFPLITGSWSSDTTAATSETLSFPCSLIKRTPWVFRPAMRTSDACWRMTMPPLVTTTISSVSWTSLMATIAPDLSEDFTVMIPLPPR